MVKKTLWIWGIGVIVGFYATFVLQSLWNWFAVPALQVPPIGYWLMFGLNFFVGLMLERSEQGDQLKQDQHWNLAMTVLDACVPDGKQAELRESVEREADRGMWVMVLSLIVGRILSNTFALGVGWAVHTALT